MIIAYRVAPVLLLRLHVAVEVVYGIESEITYSHYPSVARQEALEGAVLHVAGVRLALLYIVAVQAVYCIGNELRVAFERN